MAREAAARRVPRRYLSENEAIVNAVIAGATRRTTEMPPTQSQSGAPPESPRLCAPSQVPSRRCVHRRVAASPLRWSRRSTTRGGSIAPDARTSSPNAPPWSEAATRLKPDPPSHAGRAGIEARPHATPVTRNLRASYSHDRGDTNTLIAPTGDNSAQHVPSRKQVSSATPPRSPVLRRTASSGLRPRLPLSSDLRFGTNSRATPVPTMQPQRRLPIA